MRLQQRVGPHIGPDIAIIDAIERIQLDCVSLEVPWQEGRADAEFVFLSRFLPLHVVEKNGDVWNVRFR